MNKPKNIIKLLQHISGSVGDDVKYWGKVYNNTMSQINYDPSLRLPMNSAQRSAQLRANKIHDSYQYFQRPQLARPYFEQVFPPSRFGELMPKGQTGKVFDVLDLLKQSDNPYLKSVHREMRQYYPVGKQLGMPQQEIIFQMDSRLRDLLNNMYRVNTPYIFKNGGILNGKIEKFWPGGLIGKGAKWLATVRTADILRKAPRPTKPYVSRLFDISHPIGKYNDLIKGSTQGPVTFSTDIRPIEIPGRTVKSAQDLFREYPNVNFTTGGYALTDGTNNFVLANRPGRQMFYNIRTNTLYDFGPGNTNPNILVTQRLKGSAPLSIENGILYPAEYKNNHASKIWWEQNRSWQPDSIVPTFIIDDVIPTESALEKTGWGSKWSRLSGPVDLADPKLNFRFITKDPVTGFPVESPFVFPKQSQTNSGTIFDLDELLLKKGLDQTKTQ